jgi:hypothetical protein
VNIEKVAELQLSVNRMCGEDLPKDGSASEYQRRINGQVQDTDRAKIHTYWKKLIREAYAKFRYFLDFNVVDPEKVIKKETTIKNGPLTKTDIDKVSHGALIASLTALPVLSPRKKLDSNNPVGLCYGIWGGQTFGLILNYILPEKNNIVVGCGCYRILGLLDIEELQKSATNDDLLKPGGFDKYLYDDDDPIEKLRKVREGLFPDKNSFFKLVKKDVRNDKHNLFYVLPGKSVWLNDYKEGNKSFKMVWLDKDFKNPTYFKIGKSTLEKVTKVEQSNLSVNMTFATDIKKIGYKEWKIVPVDRFEALKDVLAKLFPL